MFAEGRELSSHYRGFISTSAFWVPRLPGRSYMARFAPGGKSTLLTKGPRGEEKEMKIK